MHLPGRAAECRNRLVAIALAAALGLGASACGGPTIELMPPLRNGDVAPAQRSQSAPMPAPVPRPPEPQVATALPAAAVRPPRIPQSARLAGFPAPGGRALSAGTVVDRIMVFKSERRLYLMQGFRPVKGYDIALGFAPIGHKERQGDGRTPEGLYLIEAKNPASQFHLSLRVSYPGGTDVARARRFREDPGGDIMVHGLPNVDERNVARHHPYWDWTWGCIAVSNEEIREIWDAVPVGTTIEILP